MLKKGDSVSDGFRGPSPRESRAQTHLAQRGGRRPRHSAPGLPTSRGEGPRKPTSTHAPFFSTLPAAFRRPGAVRARHAGRPAPGTGGAARALDPERHGHFLALVEALDRALREV